MYIYFFPVCDGLLPRKREEKSPQEIYGTNLYNLSSNYCYYIIIIIIVNCYYRFCID